MKACPCLHLRAALVGALAFRSLTAVPVSGRVHSVFKHAVNVCRGQRGWFCLHDHCRALHPYSVVVEGSFLPSVEPGEQLVVSRLGIEFLDSGIEVEIGRAPVWDSRLRPFDQSEETFGPRMRRAAGILRKVGAEQHSASPFLSAVSCPEVKLAGAATSPELFRARAAQLVSRLTQDWIGGRDDLAGTLVQLVGFGPGLTPSGDDFLLGLLGADHYFTRISGNGDDRAEFGRAMRRQLPALLCSTTVQSRLMLEAALEGHYPAPVSGLLASTGEGREDGIRESVARLRNVGATSGDDVLAGILLWLETRARGESL